MQPVCGNTIFAEFLDTHNEGIQHVAFDCNNIPWEDRLREFERRGYKCVQGGSWMDKNHFAFFETQEATTTTFETYSFPEDWEYPVPEETYPPRHIFSEI